MTQSGANVCAIETLGDLRSALDRHSDNTREAMAAVERDILRTQDWLRERELHWQRVTEQQRQAIAQAERAYRHCLSISSQQNTRSGGYRGSACVSEATALRMGQSALHQAEQKLSEVKRWQSRVNESIREYQVWARRLERLMADRAPKARAYLASSLEYLRAYQVLLHSSQSPFVQVTQESTAGVPTITGIDRIRGLEWLQPDRWRSLDEYERKAVLNEVGQMLGQVYGHATPPLFILDLGKPNSLGYYGDGYHLEKETGLVTGANYGIHINRFGEVDYKRLLGNDPAVALETYAHEFRHSYQAEQASRCLKPELRNLVDDPDLARTWATNFDDYIPSDRGFEAYRAQPIERDAREFAAELVREIFGSRPT